MSYSTLYKKKGSKRKEVILSDSESDSNENSKRKRPVKASVPAKKATQNQALNSFSSTDDEDPELFNLVKYVDSVDRFDIIQNKVIYFDELINRENRKTGRVKHLGKFYDIIIIKTGSKDYMEKKAKRYAHCLSITTCDEVETERQIHVSKNLHSKDNEIPKSNASRRVVSIDLNESLRSESPQPDTTQSSVNTLQLFEDFIKQTKEREVTQQQYLEEIEKKIENITQLRENKSFVYNGVDLLSDVDGYPIHIWASKCLDVLFTSEETKNCVLVKSTHSTRDFCCPIRVQLLKDALKYKYNLPGEKQDKIWRKIADAFNTKGRVIKHNMTFIFVKKRIIR
ncbi:hypothetical protein BpHYR1_031029 [Brachionus plicatilis]|uniref:Uncharacterized protein n=1 Tax=Brachionus plicatilis TaxID=10195 RepID=A0A3M7P872_BRAPC|nr:hypothetical protein BpHYR1_031029 [Brachionus plicatilis]